MTERERRGKIGEETVRQWIDTALSISGVQGYVFDNVIVKYPSIFGYYGIMTTEIDHIVVTNGAIFVFKTKNQELKEWNLKEPEWVLINNETVSNPIIQNQNHKKILCSALGVHRENIITVECLLRQAFSTPFMRNINDYVFFGENVIGFLALLFVSKTYTEFEFENVVERLEQLKGASNRSRNGHNKNVEKQQDAQKWIKSHIGYHMFKMTDIANCPWCGALLNLVPGSWVDTERNNERKSPQYMVGCSSNKNGCKFAKRYMEFGDIMITSIEERNGWGEMEIHNTTVLDEYMELKRNQQRYLEQIDDLKSGLSAVKKENEVMAMKLQETRREMNVQQEKYRNIIGPFYFKK